ncbi:MAG: SDR family oxidoreductase [Beijerinckiaceae bacterium]|nr:SDR family oxidoreductase [Beijerinckiaceae bacterium]
MNLFVFGLGYSATHYVQTRRASYAHVAATARSAEKRAALARQKIAAFDFSPEASDQGLRETLATADHLLVSIPPGAQGDPALAHFAGAIEAAPYLRSIVYLSTIGVYGDHAGAWIDESTQPVPSSERSVWRLAAEEGWRKLARDKGIAAHVLRLAGIYGPGQNALVNLRAGTAKRIIKPGQVFNRIHVEDIARAIEAAFAFADPCADRVWNVCDDEPAPPQDVVTYAASLLGVAPPAEIAFETAELSPMARSFYSECKRCSNRAMREELGVRLACPTYREGMDQLYAAGDGR